MQKVSVAFCAATPGSLSRRRASNTPRRSTARRPRTPRLPSPRLTAALTVASVGSPPDVAIIGGGAAGLSTAVAAAMAGASVKVLSRAPAEAAIVAAAGMLAPNAENLVSGAMGDLVAASRAMYPEYARMLQRVTGEDVGFVSRGDVLYPLLEGEDVPEGVANFGRYIRKDALQFVEAALGPRVAGAYEIPADAQVNNRALFTALRKACDVLGVDVVEGVDVVRAVVSPDGRHVERLVLSSGDDVVAGHYVAAAGAWTQKVLPNVPMRPVKGQMLCLEPGGRSGACDGVKLEHLLYGSGLYIVPKKNGSQFYVGATVEDVGFDSEVTAGGVSELLRKAIEMVPSFSTYRIAESWAGFRPATPDLLPVLGLSTYSNMSVASGYYRNGVLMVPATAKIAASVALGNEKTLEPQLRRALEAFSCSRFGDEPPAEAQPRREHVSTQLVGATGVGRTRAESPAAPIRDEEASDDLDELDILAREAGTDVLMFEVLPDGSKKPLRRGETPEVFKQGAGDIAGEEEAIRAAKLQQQAEQLARERLSREGSAPPEVEKSVEPKTELMPAKKSSYINDAYDDILAMQGKEQEEKEKLARTKNRSFGVEQRPGHEGEYSSLSPSEWDALDAAFDKGQADASSLPLELEDYAAAMRKRVLASGVSETDSLASGAEQESKSESQGLNGFRMPLFGRGNRASGKDSE